MNRDFLKEAIADAKAVKESAIANAKIALEEAFNPKLKSMLSAKLEEMDNSYEEDDITTEAENEIEEETIDENISEEKDEMEEEIDLDEILNELEETADSLEEAEEAEETEETEEEEEEEEEAENEEDDIDIEDMSEDDLKKFIEGVIEDMVKSGELEAGEESEEESEEEIDIDGMDMDIEDEDEEEEEEVVAEEEMEVDEEMKDELNEAYATINSLKSELQEINLLNAKLLYSNKIFKTKSLSESQKVKVLGTFDKATTVKEVKLVFETINEGLKVKTTKRISESMVGSASKSLRTPKTTKKPILETDDMVSRFQKLAGINKIN
tara:strand:- start:1717 stop:2691 length:975 start_codon:yes stop_codon:yes gene_type:complete